MISCLLDTIAHVQSLVIQDTVSKVTPSPSQSSPKALFQMLKKCTIVCNKLYKTFTLHYLWSYEIPSRKKAPNPKKATTKSNQWCQLLPQQYRHPLACSLSLLFQQKLCKNNK